MKLHYYPDTDSLYIELADRPGADAQEVAPGVVVDFDAAGDIVGIDIDNAGKVVDFQSLTATDLPIKSWNVKESDVA